MLFNIFQHLRAISTSIRGCSPSLSISGHGYIPRGPATHSSGGSGRNGGGKPQKTNQKPNSGSGGQNSSSGGSGRNGGGKPQKTNQKPNGGSGGQISSSRGSAKNRK